MKASSKLGLFTFGYIDFEQESMIALGDICSRNKNVIWLTLPHLPHLTPIHPTINHKKGSLIVSQWNFLDFSVMWRVVDHEKFITLGHYALQR